jgi:hypothetical protein
LGLPVTLAELGIDESNFELMAKRPTGIRTGKRRPSAASKVVLEGHRRNLQAGKIKSNQNASDAFSIWRAFQDQKHFR